MTDYYLLTKQLESLISDIEWDISILANASALIWGALEDINWAGFYLMRGEQLELGPFQGKPACVVIGPGKGVCGAAAEQDATQLVPDVHAFPGHIACDAASASEIVVPIRSGGRVIAVLDLDSPTAGRFTEADRAGLEAFVRELENVAAFD